MANLPEQMIFQQGLPTAAERASGSLPAIVADRAPRQRRTRRASGFQPGLRVRVILAGGEECDGIVRWDGEDGRRDLRPDFRVAEEQRRIERLP